MKFENSLAFARSLDQQDTLKDYRKLFHIPKVNGKEAIYLCGNSLGLQPKSVEKHLKVELEDWKNLGVEGHVHGKNPWLYYHHFFSKSISKLVGAKESEEKAQVANVPDKIQQSIETSISFLEQQLKKIQDDIDDHIH